MSLDVNGVFGVLHIHNFITVCYTHPMWPIGWFRSGQSHYSFITAKINIWLWFGSASVLQKTNLRGPDTDCLSAQEPHLTATPAEPWAHHMRMNRSTYQETFWIDLLLNANAGGCGGRGIVVAREVVKLSGCSAENWKDTKTFYNIWIA